MEKKHFYAVNFYPVSSTVNCTCCDSIIITEDDYVYVDFSSEFDEEVDEEFIEVLESKDFEEIEDYCNSGSEIWSRATVCKYCYDNIGRENSTKYKTFLDLVFKDYPKQTEMYKEYMSECFPNSGSGSCRTLNKILNSIYYYDYYTVDITGIGVFDPDNREFVKQTLINFSGVDIDLMRQKNKEKNRALGYSVD